MLKQVQHDKSGTVDLFSNHMNGFLKKGATMCGFAGFYNIQRSGFSVSEKLLDRMQQRIVHRGPDAGGIWKSDEYQIGLTARRLSIIDLSESGNQPMVCKQHNVVLCFNGEIYNYKMLRKELECLGFSFTSTSDTEVIVAAYKAWGFGCLHRLEGMFAFVLFDMTKHTCFLARDRIGVKPLYFSLQGGVLSFASEIKALWVLPWIEKNVSDLAWYHYLTFMVTPAPYTIFEGVYKLPAGFYAEVDMHKRIAFHEWYTPLNAFTGDNYRAYESENACIERIYDLLVESTKKRMVSDVPVGAYLSGGLDSSLNVALMSQFSSRVKTFTIAFDDDTQELGWAREVAKLFGTDHHEIVISEKEAFDYYERMVYQLDEPLADCVCIPFYYLSKLAHDRGMKVVQVGEGADELFFGYSLYARYAALYKHALQPAMFMPALFRRGLASALRPFVAAKPFKTELLHNFAQGNALFWGGATAFGEDQKTEIRSFFSKRLLNPDYVIGQIYPGLQQAFDSHSIVHFHCKKLLDVAPHADIGMQMLYLELKQRLPELLLMRADKMSMAASIEAREPFLDHHLVEFMLTVPLSMRFKNNTTKYLLKKVAQRVLPDHVIYRPKVGFGAPTARWFAQGRYFPSYFQAHAESAGQFPAGEKKSVFGAVSTAANTNDMHRAVQNWVLQQMWTFTQVNNGRF